MRVILFLFCALSLSGCLTTTLTKVDTCPQWVEVGTTSLDDTELSKRWMYRYESNRQRECGNSE